VNVPGRTPPAGGAAMRAGVRGGKPVQEWP